MWRPQPVCNGCGDVLPVPLPNARVHAFLWTNETTVIIMPDAQLREAASTHIHLCNTCLVEAVKQFLGYN